MTKPNLSPLFDRINARAYAILQQHGKTLEQLQEYTVEQLNEIKGIGDRWATDIRAALDSLQPVPAVTDPPDWEYIDTDAPTAIELAHTPMDELSDAEGATLLEAVLIEVPDDESPLDMALRYLRACGREADAEVLAGKVDRDGADAVTETAIAILEGLPGGELPKNLAQDVRERAGL